ncbi:MAG: hypothetical protein IJ460_07865 [Clostridia bacterium]|nr:hypothetical protein [Clostridia bacterium]
MKYYKNTKDQFDINLFKNPPKEYRGAPFWSWNSRLEEGALSRQIHAFKDMGFGGFYMHPRGGMATPYLSEEYMHCISHCIQEAKGADMLACLYDEDRWPSGYAGGKVTENPVFRQRALYVTKDKNTLPYIEPDSKKALAEGSAYMVACFDIEFDENNYIKSCIRCDAESEEKFTKYYFYCQANEPSDRFNFYTFSDLFMKEAAEKFTQVTHKPFYEWFGADYGGTVPTIFSDEPRHRPHEWIKEDGSSEGVFYWSYNLPESFKREYGYDITDRLPYIVWDRANIHSNERYDYFNHCTDLFAKAFFGSVTEATSAQGLMYCGHLMLEDELYGQLRWTGDSMRLYPYFDIPGIDILFDRIEFVGAKQAQSVVRQYGKEAMLSELYGVTGWDFDFRCLKMQGDWQAAMGVTVRVPHLSMYSMKGSAKRDYPSTFNYQAPWYKEFKYLENHYARLSYVLTRGKPLADVGVIHPIETVMLTLSTEEKSKAYVEALDKEIHDIAAKLLYANLDFDFISEGNLVNQKVEAGDGLRVGEMKYSAVVVPSVKTLRSSTVKILEDFAAKGGIVVFTGECPGYADGRPSDKIRSLYGKAQVSDCDHVASKLKPLGRVSIESADSPDKNRMIYQLREEGDKLWLFAARAEKMGKTSPERSSLQPTDYTISVKGEYGVQIYDTMSGEILPADYEIKDGITTVKCSLHISDSILLDLKKEPIPPKTTKKEEAPYKTLVLENAVFRRHEPNSAVFDIGSYSFDGKGYSRREYVLEINKEISQRLGIELTDAQPYVITDSEPSAVYIKYEFDCTAPLDGLCLAMERAGDAQIYLNGEKVISEPKGYFTDEDIRTVALPKTKKGCNEIVIKTFFSILCNIEPCYLLGEFRTRVNGSRITLMPEDNCTIDFEPLGKQGMLFYGGNISYMANITTDKCTAVIKVQNFTAPCVRVYVDGRDAGLIALSPFCVRIELEAGEHEIELVCYGNRNNTFGPIHNKRISDPFHYIGPMAWTKNEFWTEDFCFQDTGILASPVIELYKN